MKRKKNLRAPTVPQLLISCLVLFYNFNHFISRFKWRSQTQQSFSSEGTDLADAHSMKRLDEVPTSSADVRRNLWRQKPQRSCLSDEFETNQVRGFFFVSIPTLLNCDSRENQQVGVRGYRTTVLRVLPPIRITHWPVLHQTQVVLVRFQNIQSGCRLSQKGEARLISIQ